MCSCVRDAKPEHTEACRKAHRKYVRGPKFTRAKARRVLRFLGASK